MTPAKPGVALRTARLALLMSGAGALVAAAPATASSGDLVAAYGRGGIASVVAPVSADAYSAVFTGRDRGPSMVIASDGSVLIARAHDGRCALERLAGDGLGDAVPLGPAVPCNNRLRPEVNLGPAGEILFAYAPDAESVAIELRRADGTSALQFGTAGRVARQLVQGGLVGRCHVSMLPDGDIVLVANTAAELPQTGYTSVVVLRLNWDGSADSWGTNGVVGLRGFEWGPLTGEGIGVRQYSSDVVLFGSADYGFFQQTFSRQGRYYPYFPPESSVDSSQPVVSEFNDGQLAALFRVSGTVYYDGPQARLSASSTSDWTTLQLPATAFGADAKFTPLRFRPLAGGGLLIAGVRERSTTGGTVFSELVLLKMLASGALDAAFGRAGVATIDLPLGGPPYALPLALTAPTLVGQDRVVVAAWNQDRLATAAVALATQVTSPGSIGLLAADGRMVTRLEPQDATIRVRVRRAGGQRGAVSATYRTQASPALAAQYQPIAGRLDWADGDDSARELVLALRAPTSTPEFGPVDLLLENPGGGATLATAAYRVELVDLSGGALDFSTESLLVSAGSATVRIGVVRSGRTRGAITAAVRMPIEGSAARTTLGWADGESGVKFVELPLPRDWVGFEARLENPPRTALGAKATVKIEIDRTQATTVPPVATPPVLIISNGNGGGGALAPWLLAALALTLALRRRRHLNEHRPSDSGP